MSDTKDSKAVLSDAPEGDVGDKGSQSDSSSSSESSNDAKSGSESSESEEESSDTEEQEQEEPETKKPLIPNTMPLIKRKAFPFSVWLQTSLGSKTLPSQEFIEETTEIIRDVVLKLLEVDEQFDIWMIRGNREFDRLRIICPQVIVNAETAIDLRSLILARMGYKENAEIIPTTCFYYESVPTIFLPRQKDIGTGKWESHQTYKDLMNPDKKTEDIERGMVRMSLYDTVKPPKLCKHTSKYDEFLAMRLKGDVDNAGGDNEEELDQVDEEMKDVFAALARGDPTAMMNSEGVPAVIKKKLGKKVDECIKWFGKFHPDAKLRFVREIREDLYLFDFTKSKAKCRLCKVSHISNRQYVVYSGKSQKGFYHCHDSDARDRSIAFSLRGPRRGAKIVSVDDV